MIKKSVIILTGLVTLVLIGMTIYFRLYQNLPEFSISILPKMPEPKASDKIVIFAPHTDDEVIGEGGYIADALKNNASVTIVFITNGDGHRFSSVEEFHTLYPNASDYIASGYDRQDESKNALKILGLKEQQILFLGYPDGGIKELLTTNWQTPYKSSYTQKSSSPYTNSYTLNTSYTGVNLEDDISKILNQIQPDEIFVTNPSDIHPDHAAAGEFVTRAYHEYKGQHLTSNPELYFYLVHFRHFPYPKGYHPNNYLMPPIRLLTGTWLNYPLSQNTENLKYNALQEYHSQLKVPMLNSLMQGFVKKNELFQKVN